jgi:ABC-type glycerol-3-phosphate transport system substrate-binding protein
MAFWQLTIDANDPALLARFWAQALGYQPAPPAEPDSTWHQHYRARLGAQAAFSDRLFDPAGLRPPIWFQEVPESKAGKTGSTWTSIRPAATGPCRWRAG